jgi:hypothetical protein
MFSGAFGRLHGGGNVFELIVQPLAHCAISHFFVPFDAVLQFSSCFYYVFHNLQLLCSPRFGATVLITFLIQYKGKYSVVLKDEWAK